MTSEKTTSFVEFSTARKEAIAALKLDIRTKTLRRESTPCETYIYYNLLRGVEALRGITFPKTLHATQVPKWLTSINAVNARITDGPDVQDLRHEWQRSLRAKLMELMAYSAKQGCRTQLLTYLRRAMEATPHGASSNTFNHGKLCAYFFGKLENIFYSQGAVQSKAQLARRSYFMAIYEQVPDWLRPLMPELFKEAVTLLGSNTQAMALTYLTYHDCGKVTTMTRSSRGIHFPGHAKESARLWREYFPTMTDSALLATLMEEDMLLHSGSLEEVAEKAHAPYIPLLIVSTFSQILANAKELNWEADAACYQKRLLAFKQRVELVLSLRRGA